MAPGNSLAFMVHAEEQVKRRVLSANRQLDRMVNLIEEMLDVSRIGTGKLQMKFETLDLGDVTREVMDRFAEQFSVLGLRVEINIQPANILIFGDRYRLEQVLSNLLTNAIKYGSGTPISVSLLADGSAARWVVRDEGIGIAKANLDRIFDRFERAISSGNISGLGLGLYITRQILEAHRAKISVESELGKGSKFTVEIPLL